MMEVSHKLQAVFEWTDRERSFLVLFRLSVSFKLLVASCKNHVSLFY